MYSTLIAIFAPVALKIFYHGGQRLIVYRLWIGPPLGFGPLLIVDGTEVWPQRRLEAARLVEYLNSK